MKKFILASMFVFLPFIASAHTVSINTPSPACGTSLTTFSGTANYGGHNNDHLVGLLNGSLVFQSQSEPLNWNFTATTTVGTSTVTMKIYDKPNDNSTHTLGQFDDVDATASKTFTVNSCPPPVIDPPATTTPPVTPPATTTPPVIDPPATTTPPVVEPPVTPTPEAPKPPVGGGAMPWCSGPMAPGWNVSLPNGGCGGGSNPTFGGVSTTTPPTNTVLLEQLIDAMKKLVDLLKLKLELSNFNLKG